MDYITKANEIVENAQKTLQERFFEIETSLQ